MATLVIRAKKSSRQFTFDMGKVVVECFTLTWVNLLAVLQDLDGQQEGEHELVGLKQAAAHVDEEGVREGLIQGPAALLHALCLQQDSLQQLVELFSVLSSAITLRNAFI